MEAGAVSDPLLMTGFDMKVLLLAHDRDGEVTFTVEVDFLGDGTWKPYRAFTVPAKVYVHHEFPDAYSAHWVRVRVDARCRSTAQFIYN